MNYKPTVFVKISFLKSPSGDSGVNGRTVKIHVISNNPGIYNTIKVKIFQPFFTIKPTGQVTSLGLDVVRRIIVNWVGGEINFVKAKRKQFLRC